MCGSADEGKASGAMRGRLRVFRYAERSFGLLSSVSHADWSAAAAPDAETVCSGIGANGVQNL